MDRLIGLRHGSTVLYEEESESAKDNVTSAQSVQSIGRERRSLRATTDMAKYKTTEELLLYLATHLH